MSFMARFFGSLALTSFLSCGLAQSSTSGPHTLHSVVQELKSNPENHGPQWAAKLDGPINAATIVEIKQELPALVALTESPNPQQRGNALLVLYGIAERQKAGLPENRREMDLSWLRHAYIDLSKA